MSIFSTALATATMATSFEGDAEWLTLGACHFFCDGSNLTAKASYAELNKDGRSRVIVPTADIFYTLPARNQNVAVVQLGYGTEAFSGWLDLRLQAPYKESEYVSGKKIKSRPVHAGHTVTDSRCQNKPLNRQ